MNQVAEDSTRITTTVVVPCYNEAKRIDLGAFAQFLTETSDVCLLLVDDGSTDDTPLLIEQLRRRYPRQVNSLRLDRNVGKAEAVRRGMRLALRRQPTIVGFWDADLATPLEAITELRDVLLARPSIVMVLGSRVALLGRKICRKGARHILGRAFATAASLVLGIPIYDTQCGAKLFRVTPATVALFQTPFRARWVFDVEILARFSRWHGSDALHRVHDLICEFPLREWRDVGGSRLRPVDFFVAAIDLVAIYGRYMRRPSDTDSADLQRTTVTSPVGSESKAA